VIESTHVYYTDGFKYRLSRPFNFPTKIYGFEGGNSWLWLHADGWLEARVGYVWDGASGPKDTQSVMRAALVHDCLYQLIRLDVLPEDFRAFADGLLRDLMDADSPKRRGLIGGLVERWNDFRGWYWWIGVRRFGGASVRPSAERPEKRAP
jgi:hypothetical protein